jgi:hypothetical protein
MRVDKITIHLKQKRFVFGLLKAKYWAEAESDISGVREGFRNIHIYEAELTCKATVLGFNPIHSGEKIRFSNQDKLRKKFNAITVGDSSGPLREAIHSRDISDVEEMVNADPCDQNTLDVLHQYVEDYNKYPIRAIQTNFITSFPRPIQTVVQLKNGIEKYELNFESAKLYNFRISKVQDEGAESFGTISGTFIGYVVDLIPQEIDEIIPPLIRPDPPPLRKYPYLTGKSESRTVARVVYRRYEICEAPREYVWSDWKVIGRVSESQRIYTFWEAAFWLFIFVIFLGLLIYAWPALLLISGIIAVAWLFSLNAFGKFFRYIGRVIGGALSALSVIFVVGGVISLIANNDIFGRNYAVTTDVPNENLQQEQIIDGDTIIAHYREWNDYSGNHYRGYLRVYAADYRNSKHFRMNCNTVDGEAGYRQLCSSLVERDSSGMKLIYAFFDTLRIEKELDRDQFAEAIITCIQDIPYYLITPGPCEYSAYSKNDFAHNYLLGGGLCQGYETNGILSPIEFSATMKGDCDTRTVFAYTLLKHFGYDVCVLGSEYYGHSVLGIDWENSLPDPVLSYVIRGQPYAMCELTTYGPRPGQIPDEVSNTKYWKVELN